MSTPSTDVSTAQSFDVMSFLGNLANIGTQAIAQKIAPTQATGQPAVTTQPNLKVGSGGNAAPATGGMSQQTLVYAGLGLAAVVGLVLILRK